MDRMRFYSQRLLILLIIFIGLRIGSGCAGLRELNTKPENKGSRYEPLFETDILPDTTSLLQILELDESIANSPEIQYLETLVAKITKYGQLKERRVKRAIEIEKLTNQETLHGEITAEIALLEIQILNTKRQYNSAALNISSSILKQAALPSSYK